MHALSFEQAPPPSVPLRFFLTAPLFLVLAGVLLVVDGAAVFASRWTPSALALTHLLTAGFMLQVMLGALFQLMPVAAGANLWRPRLLAWPVHLLCAVGALALVAGFHHGVAGAYLAAALCLGLGLGGFVACALHALLRSPARGPSVVALRLSVGGLVLAVAAGASMALARGGFVDLAWLRLSSVHVGIGLAGWGGVLVAGTAYLVVPMFQLTPAYPDWFSRWYAWAVLAAVIVGAAVPDAWAWLPLLALIAGFALMTLDRQRRRRRAKVDVTLRLWRLAMLSIIGACAAAALALFGIGGNALPLMVGVLVLMGGFVSVIVGMLYKIVPFVLWLYLQPRVTKLPPMTRMLSEPLIVWHWRAHLALLACLLAAPLWPPLGHVGGGGMLLAAGLLGASLLRVVQQARAALRRGQPL
ncbi:MAG: hypothetical protein KDE64_06330 [Rhodocyclaceae bacterium]|nr:hypothetical protein [Rhodocyclaceae bacterium]